MNYFGKIKRYFVELWQAVSLFPCLLRGRSARVGGIVGATSTYALMMMQLNTVVAMAATTELFQKLGTAVETLYNDLQGIVTITATLMLVACILGIFLASMFGPRATATMTSALKMIICFFIVWQLTPVILRTLISLFGTAGGGTSSGTESVT